MGDRDLDRPGNVADCVLEVDLCSEPRIKAVSTGWKTILGDLHEDFWTRHMLGVLREPFPGSGVVCSGGCYLGVMTAGENRL